MSDPLVNEALKNLTCADVAELLEKNDLSEEEQLAIVRHSNTGRCTTRKCTSELIKWQENHQK